MKLGLLSEMAVANALFPLSDKLEQAAAEPTPELVLCRSPPCEGVHRWTPAISQLGMLSAGLSVSMRSSSPLLTRHVLLAQFRSVRRTPRRVDGLSARQVCRKTRIAGSAA